MKEMKMSLLKLFVFNLITLGYFQVLWIGHINKEIRKQTGIVSRFAFIAMLFWMAYISTNVIGVIDDNIQMVAISSVTHIVWQTVQMFYLLTLCKRIEQIHNKCHFPIKLRRWPVVLFGILGFQFMLNRIEKGQYDRHQLLSNTLFGVAYSR